MFLGYTDLPSRLPTQSSTLYSNNITKFLLSMSTQERHFSVDLTDEVIRGSIVTHRGEVLPVTPRPAPPPAPAPSTAAAEKEAEMKALTPWQKASREVATVTGGMGAALALGKVDWSRIHEQRLHFRSGGFDWLSCRLGRFSRVCIRL